MGVDDFLALLGDEVEDPDEETFLLFSQPIPSQNLGFLDPKAAELEVAVGGREYTIQQSPGVLESSRAGGTTGAVLWKITPLFASWLASPTNPLFTTSVLTPTSCVLELGCGTSGLIGLAAARRVARYTLTDQAYVARVLSANLAANAGASASPQKTAPSGTARKEKAKGKASITRSVSSGGSSSSEVVAFTPLDWELDVPTPALTRHPHQSSFDAVIACDCVYNEALVRPFVSACADACALRSASPRSASPGGRHGDERVRNDHDGARDDESDERGREPTLCLVAQQLRDPEVFEAWLRAFHQRFRTWRAPPEIMGQTLGEGSGFVVHVGILRE